MPEPVIGRQHNGKEGQKRERVEDHPLTDIAARRVGLRALVRWTAR
jgi:hypothetical protein